MRQPQVSAWDRVMRAPSVAFPTFIDPGSYLTVEVKPQLGNTEDGRELRSEEKNPQYCVSRNLPHEGSVDGRQRS